MKGKPDLAIVFGKGKGDEDDAKGDDMDSESAEDSAEMDDALGAAVEDLFKAKDSAARLEAFKTAVNLCKESSY